MSEFIESGQGEPRVSSFKAHVLDRQHLWKALKKVPFSERPHAFDIPENITKNYLQNVITNLPPYVPDSIREQIRLTHPEPIISTGMLVDKRFFKDGIPHKKTAFPSEVKDEDKSAWQDGIALLDEIATDTLAGDIIKRWSKSERWFSPMTILLKKHNAKNAYRGGVQEIKRQFNEKAKVENFRQELILAMLTGKTDTVDQNLEQYGYDSLNQFAITLGQRERYIGDAPEGVKKAIGERLSESLATHGVVDKKFPGVITLPMLSSMPRVASGGLSSIFLGALPHTLDRPFGAFLLLTSAGITGSVALKFPRSLPSTLLHETCHYLGQDINHAGLQPLTPTLT